MLRSMNDLQGFTLRAKDGDIGRVDEFYFDDDRWAVRYVVADTGSWMGRRVLISPISFTSTDWNAKAMDVSLTRDQIRKSPDADLHGPVSRQYEQGYSAYYGYPPYWIGPGYWGAAAHPGQLSSMATARAERAATAAALEDRAESHLRSSSEVKGYHIQATDGEIGHVDDFLVDDQNWAIRYLRVDTSNWIGGKAVLVPQSALRDVSWRDQKIHVGISREQVKNSPEYDPSRLDPDYEQRLGAYYTAVRR